MKHNLFADRFSLEKRISSSRILGESSERTTNPQNMKYRQADAESVSITVYVGKRSVSSLRSPAVY